MNKSTAEKIAKSGQVAWGQIQALLQQAYGAGAADESRSAVNKSFSKGAMFNVMWGYAKEYSPDRIVDGRCYDEWIGARHCLVEFGCFWDGWTPDKHSIILPDPIHQEAIAPFAEVDNATK